MNKRIVLAKGYHWFIKHKTEVGYDAVCVLNKPWGSEESKPLCFSHMPQSQACQLVLEFPVAATVKTGRDVVSKATLKAFLKMLDPKFVKALESKKNGKLRRYLHSYNPNLCQPKLVLDRVEDDLMCGLDPSYTGIHDKRGQAKRLKEIQNWLVGLHAKVLTTLAEKGK